jgi:phospholipase C
MTRARKLSALATITALIGQPIVPVVASAGDDGPDSATPIKHVIVIIGENRTFDHVFATYKPAKGESVDNLLSKGIVSEDGTPGPNFYLAGQFSAVDKHANRYDPSPASKSLYATLPAPLAGGPENVCTNNGICTTAEAKASENR